MTLLLRALRRVVRIFARDDVYLGIEVEDVPDDVIAGRVYIVGSRDSPWSAAFLCPCGCCELVHLSLIPDDEPSWSLIMTTSGKVTLQPSINRHRGCHSHFFVRGGRIEWARSSR